MNIRIAKASTDLDQIKKICDEKVLTLPDFEYCLVVEDDAGNIVAFANVVTIPTIDCFVSDNPAITRKLFDTVMGGALATGKRAIQFYSKREDVIELYKHMDFTILGEGYTIARKDF